MRRFCRVLVKISKMFANPHLHIHWKDREKVVSLQLPDVFNPF